MENLKMPLEQNHAYFDHWVKVNIYLTDVPYLPLVISYLPP